MIRIPASRSAIGATSAIGSARPDPECEPDREPDRRVAERERDPGEREDAEGEHEGGEPEPEQDAVEPGRERHRHHPAPVLGQLAAQLGQDRHPAQLGDRGDDGDRRGDQVREAPPAPLDQPAERREQAEGDHAARERPDRERDAGRDRRRPPAGVADRADRLDHREPARRPGAADAGEQRRDEQGELEPAQQGTLVWKYITQKTLRPR